MTSPDIQHAQDMLTAMQAQRDTAINANVHAQAQIFALQREVGKLQKEIAELQKTAASEVAQEGE